MRLRSDTRGRVPFALVGVVLLVSSAAYTGVLATHDPVNSRTPGERALATATTSTHAAIEQAALNASQTAAGTPLTKPADTPMGRVLKGSDPFERYLRLLIYVQSRRALSNVSARAGGVTVEPALPPVRSPQDARDAINRTQVERVADGQRLRVTIRDVAFTLTENGASIGSHDETITVVVASPVLALHDRTSTYDDRLDTGPIEGPGLGRRLTARLWLIAQARGMAQYGKAPIANVLANRHVELQTNAAAVALQQDAFGSADDGSTRAVRWATARVGVHDVLAGASNAQDSWSSDVLESSTTATPEAATGSLTLPTDPPTDRTVDAQRPAARALIAVLDGNSWDSIAGSTPLEQAVADAYTIDAKRIVETRRVLRRTNRTGDRPPASVLASTHTSTSTTVEPASPGAISPPRGFETAELVGRRVIETERVEQVWRTSTGTNRTVETTTTETRVDIAVATRYTPSPAPARPVAQSAARTQLDTAASAELLGSMATRDSLAVRAATGSEQGVETAVRTISVYPPESAYRAARASVVATHERARRITGTVTASEKLDSTGATPAPDKSTQTAGARSDAAVLAAALAENRSRLLATPDQYSGPRDVARTRGRQVYLSELASELSTDQERTSQTHDALDGILAERGFEIPRVERQSVPSRTENGISVSVTPSYLPVTEVTPQMGDVDDPYHPLATRNVNVFTVPSGDVADTVADRIISEPTDTVDVAVAARALAAAENDALPENDSLALERDELRVHVADATTSLASTQTRTLARSTALNAAESKRLVRSTLAKYPSVSSRALALTNGTVSETLAVRTARRTDANRTVLEARLRSAVDRQRRKPDARVSDESVSGLSGSVRQVARDGTRKLVESGVDHAAERAKRRALAKSMASLPAGLPIAPIPGSWYLTVNVWVVDVRGAYHRVAANSVAASPSYGPDGLSYVREAGSVSFDVNGDGTPNRLGRVEPVAFSVRTVIVVAVPAGPRGVGDTGGDADERSPGWPGPEAAIETLDDAGRNETQTTPPSIGSP